jgi:signal transduction histidine kinase
MLAAARRRAEDVADELRRFSRDLRPSVLDDLGLAPALKAETSASAARAGMEITFNFTGIPERLPIEVELTLLRICQEALRNIERHARARHAAVDFERGPINYRLLVADDGVGAGRLPRPAELVEAGRLGIIGMRERARLIGASCIVHRSPPWSTVVEVVGATEGGSEAASLTSRTA